VFKNILYRGHLSELEQIFFELENSDHVLSNSLQILEESMKITYGQNPEVAKQLIEFHECLKQKLLHAFPGENNKPSQHCKKCEKLAIEEQSAEEIHATNINIFGLMYTKDESLFQTIYDMNNSPSEAIRRSVLWALSRMKLSPESNEKITKLLKSAVVNPKESFETRKLAASCLIRHFFILKWKTQTVVGELGKIKQILAVESENTMAKKL